MLNDITNLVYFPFQFLQIALYLSSFNLSPYLKTDLPASQIYIRIRDRYSFEWVLSIAKEAFSGI